MTEIVRVLRVLEYIGPRDWLEKTLAQRAVIEERSSGQWKIREAFLGRFPELWSDTEEQS